MAGFASAIFGVPRQSCIKLAPRTCDAAGWASTERLGWLHRRSVREQEAGVDGCSPNTALRLRDPLVSGDAAAAIRGAPDDATPEARLQRTRPLAGRARILRQ